MAGLLDKRLRDRAASFAASHAFKKHLLILGPNEKFQRFSHPLPMSRLGLTHPSCAHKNTVFPGNAKSAGERSIAGRSAMGRPEPDPGAAKNSFDGSKPDCMPRPAVVKADAYVESHTSEIIRGFKTDSVAPIPGNSPRNHCANRANRFDTKLRSRMYQRTLFKNVGS